MNVIIEGGTQKQGWQAKAIAEAVFAVGNEFNLFPEAFNVKITFSDTMKKDEALGVTFPPILYDTYLVDLDKNIDLEDMGWVLCHELIHVYQIYTGMMAPARSGTVYAWMGKIVERDDYEENYDEDPAEVMAWGMQDHLLKCAEVVWNAQYV